MASTKECPVCGNESDCYQIDHHLFCPLGEPEFAIGDHVTFNPYGKPVKAIVNGVLVEDGQPIRYSLHGVKRELKTLTTGASIEQSLLFCASCQNKLVGKYE